MTIVVDELTEHRSLPLPHPSNTAKDDAQRLIAALTMIDADLAGILTSLANKAASNATWPIEAVVGLVTALSNKAAVDHAHAFAGLSDVDVADIPTGRFVKWNGEKFIGALLTLADIDGASFNADAVAETASRIWFSPFYQDLCDALAEAMDEKLDLAGGVMSGALEAAPWLDLAVASTTNIFAANSNRLNLNGGGTITAFDAGSIAGRRREIRAGDASLTITHHATNMICPGGGDLKLAIGDKAIVEATGTSGRSQIVEVIRAAGASDIAKRQDIASAATVNLRDVGGHYANVTGTTGPITSFGNGHGLLKLVRLAGANSITHSANLVCPGAANLAVEAGDHILVSAQSNVWTIVQHMPAAGSGGRIVGEYIDFAGSSAPAKTIFCYGQNVSRTTHAKLFAVIGTTYGAGDGTTTFGIPDARDRSRFGKGDMGGVAAGRITNASGQWDPAVLGDTGGQGAVALSAGHIPNNSLSGAGGGSTVDRGNSGHTGSGGAHNNLPPGIVCNTLIYTG